MHHHCLDEDWFADIWRRLTVVSAVIDDLLLGSGGTLHNYTDFDNDNGTGINQDDSNVKSLSPMPGTFCKTQLTQRKLVKTASQSQGTKTGKLFNKAKRGAGTCCLRYLGQC